MNAKGTYFVQYYVFLLVLAASNILPWVLTKLGEFPEKILWSIVSLVLLVGVIKRRMLGYRNRNNLQFFKNFDISE